MSETVRTVGQSSDADYESIQSAVNDAEEGETVEVRSGRYQEQVTLDESITLEASGEVVLDGEGLGRETDGTVFGVDVGEDTRGIQIEPSVDIEPEIVGFVVRGYEVGIEADGTVGSWTIRNASLEANGDDGISAVDSEGDWRVADSVIKLNVEEGIDAGRTTGAWTVANTLIGRNGDDGIEADSHRTTSDWSVRDSEIRYNGHHGLELKESTGDWTIEGTKVTDNEFGVGAQRTSGDWVIRNSKLGDNRFVGVSCVRSSGDWQIDRTHVTNVSTGVWAPATTGDWEIANSVLGETYFVPNDNVGEGTAIVAPKTEGKWTIRNCQVRDVEQHAIDASGASLQGDARGNKWGRDGANSEIVSVGNVNCDEPRSAVPDPAADGLDAGASLDSDRLEAVGFELDDATASVSIPEVAHLLVDDVDVFE